MPEQGPERTMLDAMDGVAVEVLSAKEALAEAAGNYNHVLEAFHDVYKELSPDERTKLGEIPNIAAVMQANNNGYGPAK
jgi:hypothetical protein